MTATSGDPGADLAARLAAMLGPGAGIGWSPCEGEAGLLEDEARHLDRAVPKRRAEFAAGRRAARAALAALGHPAQAIPAGPGRAPVWPEGIAGSLTHDRDLALAAVVASGEDIGIDLTAAEALPGETRRAILPHDAEAGLDDLAARAAFSAKESLFKALYPCIETYFGFDAAIAAPDIDAGTVVLRLTGAIGPHGPGTVFTGRVERVGGALLTTLRIPAKR
ncbi:MAG: phosphopantetheinyl transferase [Pseudomonadota bacterium]|nr:phosphopantetheinyl transferase [Pseudomonadota bacterium]